MCFGGGSKPAPQQAPPPPPPPPADAPASPAYNESAANAANADAALAGSRRGRKSMRVDMNTNTGQASVSTPTSGRATAGLNVT